MSDKQLEASVAAAAAMVLVLILFLEGMGIVSSDRAQTTYRETPKSWINFVVSQPH